MYARIRERGSITNPNIAKNIVTILCDGTQSVITTPPWGAPYSEGSQEITWDVVTPGFSKKIASGAIINNPYRNVKTVSSGSHSGIWKQTYNLTCSGIAPKSYETNGPSVNLGDLPLPTLSALDIQSNIDIASTQAFARVADSDVMGLVELAEFRKTFSMLRGDILGVIKILREIIKQPKRYRRYGSTFDEAASRYLKIRYGYTPLISTIKQLLEFERAVSERFTARGSSSQSDSASKTGQINGGTWKADWVTVISKQLTVRAGVLYDYHTTLSDQLGVSPHNIPAAAYELIPFSFVVDWAVNLGDFIKAMTPKSGVNYLASWVVTREVTQIERSATFSPIQIADYTRVDNRHASWIMTTTETVRTPRACPALAFKHLNFNVHDFKHGLDAIALLKQTYRSGITTYYR